MGIMYMNSPNLYCDDLIKNDSIITDTISKINYPTDLSNYKKPEGVYKFLPNGELGKDGLVKQLANLYSGFSLRGKLHNNINTYAISFMYLNGIPYIVYFYDGSNQDEKYLVRMTLEGVVTDITDKRIPKDKYQEYQIVKLTELTESSWLPDLPEHIAVVSDILRVKEKFFGELGEYFI